jgi:hypothetical protein
VPSGLQKGQRLQATEEYATLTPNAGYCQRTTWGGGVGQDGEETWMRTASSLLKDHGSQVRKLRGEGLEAAERL